MLAARAALDIKLTGRFPFVLLHFTSFVSFPLLQVLAVVKRDIFSLPNPFAVITINGSDLR
jgi:hypothetical protein